MIAAPHATALTEALWAALVELAETANDLAVQSQARPSAKMAQRLGKLADEMCVLARAADIAARYAAMKGGGG